MKNTANKMREIANDNGAGQSLDWFLTKIEIESNKGNTNLLIYNFNIKTEIKKQLEDQGFKVDVGGRYNEIDTLINW